jgi:hypothetical protein
MTLSPELGPKTGDEAAYEREAEIFAQEIAANRRRMEGVHMTPEEAAAKLDELCAREARMPPGWWLVPGMVAGVAVWLGLAYIVIR